MLDSYLELLLYDFPLSPLLSAGLLLAGTAAALVILHFRRRWPLYLLLGLSGLCLAYAPFALYVHGGLSGGIVALAMLFFALPVLTGLLLGWALHTIWPRLQRHRLLTLFVVALLTLLLFWARPRTLDEVTRGTLRGYSTYVSDTPAHYTSNVLTSEDGGQTWQIAKVRSADEINAAIRHIRCGPTTLLLHGVSDDLPPRQLLILLGNDYLLLCTQNGPSYLLADSVASATTDWHLLLEHGGLTGFTLSQSGLCSRVLHYPALYSEIIVWLTAAE